MQSALVETLGLTKRYAEVTSLADCSLSVVPGEIYGLLGPNGSGKSTLIRLLMGFLKPTAGSARIDGLDCYRESVKVHRRLTYLPGEVRLFRQMRGRQVLRFMADVHPAGHFERSLAIADRFSLDLSRQVAYCSTGMRQKLALCAVLAAETPLVILDEPTSNLDPSARSQVLALLAEAKADGRTIIFSSHVLSETEAVCDRVAILRRGYLVLTQCVAELRRQHRLRARLTASMPVIPESIRRELTSVTVTDGLLSLQTQGELRPLLGWLAELPMAEVRVEPIGLQAVYDLYHLPGSEEESA